MAVVILEDGDLLPVLQPPVARNLAIVFVGLPVAILPLVKLARTQPQPGEQPFGGQFRPRRPMLEVIDDFVAGVVGNPASV